LNTRSIVAALALLASASSFAQKMPTSTLQKEHDALRKQAAACMKKETIAQEKRGVIMAGQVATHSSMTCGAKYSDFLMSKGNWRSIAVRKELLDMGYASIID
jgi:hypothetical protein